MSYVHRFIHLDSHYEYVVCSDELDILTGELVRVELRAASPEEIADYQSTVESPDFLLPAYPSLQHVLDHPDLQVMCSRAKFCPLVHAGHCSGQFRSACYIVKYFDVCLHKGQVVEYSDVRAAVDTEYMYFTGRYYYRSYHETF